MPAASLMQRIYEGTLPKDQLDSFAPFRDVQKVDRVVGAYREILRKFPPETIEALGREVEAALARRSDGPEEPALKKVPRSAHRV